MKNKVKPLKQPVSSPEIAKVPVVLQLESLECGAASLDMILAYYDKWIPLDVLRNDCGISRDGSNAASIYKCAVKYNLEVEAYSWDTETLREKGTFPCICFWDACHFIVVDGFKKDKVIVNDPASGYLEVPIGRFKEGFSNIVLMFKPGEGFEPSGEKESVFKYAGKIIKKLKKPIIVMGIFTFLATVIGIATPLFSQYFYDRVLPNELTIQQFMPFILAVGGVYLATFIVQIFQYIYAYRVNKTVSDKTSSNFLKKLLKLPMSFYSQRFKGDVISRQQTSEKIANSLIQVMAPLLINFLSLIFYLVVMFFYSWSLSLIGILSVVINTFTSLKISEKRVELTKTMTRDRCNLSGNTVSSLEMMDTIKSSGAEDGFFSKWKDYFTQALVATNKVDSKNSFLNLIPQFISTALGTIIIALGTIYVIRGVQTMNGALFTVGVVSAFQGFYSSFSKPVLQLIAAGQTITEMRTDMERLNDVMLYPDDKNTDSNEDKPTVELTGDIELKNVTFGYAKLGDPLITDLSIHIKAGEKVAFVGPSGCGKSTLANLISGLYESWSGQILFDGKERKDLSRETFTKQVSVVDQNIVLFPDTVRNNIKMWNENISEEDVLNASDDAQITEFVNNRPEKFDHELKDNGGDFSGGQRQSMEIARGLAINPKILILDEATSALDAKTEDAIVQAIKKRKMTTILIAHRLSTIRDADQIFVLKNGKIVESGNHESLLKLNGAYAELVRND